MNFYLLASSLPKLRYPFLACFLVLIIWLAYELNKQQKREDRAKSDFLAIEQEANSIRRKSLDALNYITIPFELIPTTLLQENIEVQNLVDEILSLKDKKIVNFSGMTNTELKMSYGAPNLPLLISYDQNYHAYTVAISKLASKYYEASYISNALILLEHLVHTGCDIRNVYFLLGTIYKQTNHYDKLQALYLTTQELNSPSRALLLSTLTTIDQTLQSTGHNID